LAPRSIKDVIEEKLFDRGATFSLILLPFPWIR